MDSDSNNLSNSASTSTSTSTSTDEPRSTDQVETVTKVQSATEVTVDASNDNSQVESVTVDVDVEDESVQTTGAVVGETDSLNLANHDAPTAVKNIKRHKFLDYYKYRDDFKINDSSLGVLLHRLRDHVLSIQNQTYDHSDTYSDIMDNFVDPLFVASHRLFHYPHEGTLEWEVANAVLEDHGKRFRTWRSHFKLGDRFIRSENNANSFFISLVDAVRERLEFYATRRFGRVYDRDVRVQDKKGKTRMVKKRIDNRAGPGGLSSAGVGLAFDYLDKMYDESIELNKVVTDLFKKFIADEKLIDEQREAMREDNDRMNGGRDGGRGYGAGRDGGRDGGKGRGGRGYGDRQGGKGSSDRSYGDRQNSNRQGGKGSGDRSYGDRQNSGRSYGDRQGSGGRGRGDTRNTTGDQKEGDVKSYNPFKTEFRSSHGPSSSGRGFGKAPKTTSQ